MSTFRDILKQWTEADLAVDMAGVGSPVSIAGIKWWKRNGVPAHRWPYLLDAAKARGIALTEAHLVAAVRARQDQSKGDHDALT